MGTMYPTAYRAAAAAAGYLGGFQPVGPRSWVGTLPANGARAMRSVNARALAGWLGRGNGAGMLAAAAILGGYAVYRFWANANTHPDYSASHTLVNHCVDQEPVGRDAKASPWSCSILETKPHQTLYGPFTNIEWQQGFHTLWYWNPALDRYASVDTYKSNWLGIGHPRPPDPSSVTDGVGEDFPPVPGVVLGRITNIRRGYDFPAAARVPPAVDPMAQPVDGPETRPWFVPYAAIPLRTSRADRVEQTIVGPAPSPRRVPASTTYPVTISQPGQRDIVMPVPIPNVDIHVGSDGSIKAVPRSQSFARPVTNVHEKKMRGLLKPGRGASSLAYAMWWNRIRVLAKRGAHYAKKGFGQFTEASDLVDNLYNALPDSVRKREFAKAGHEPGMHQKMDALWRDWRRVDQAKAAKNVLQDELQDALIGMASRGIAEATGGSPLGMTIARYGRVLNSKGD